jgi:non-specific serine/threonine protein kinase
LALPHLVKYIYNNGSDEVVRRGKKIHSLGYVEMIEHDELTGNIF